MIRSFNRISAVEAEGLRLERGKLREPVGRFFQLRRSCLQPSAKRPCVPPTGQLPRDPARLSPEGFHIPLGDLRWPLRAALPKNTTGLSPLRKWSAPARPDPRKSNCVINARNGDRINLPCLSGRDKRTGMRILPGLLALFLLCFMSGCATSKVTPAGPDTKKLSPELSKFLRQARG